MIRRYFLFQVLLGWLLALGKKIDLVSNQQPKSTANPNKVNSQTEPIVFFIATNGKDTWSGTQPIPNTDSSDGPFATCQRVQQAIRELKKQSTQLPRQIKVIFSGGTYYLRKPLVFTAEDSGTELFPIVYQAALLEQAVISGGRVISGWQETQRRGLRLWTVNLPANLQKVNFQHLWVNGERRVRARYPRQGYLKVKSVLHRQGQSWHEGDRGFRYQAGDIPRNLQLQGAEAVVMNRWVESRLPITKIDHQQQTLYFDKESVFKLAPKDIYYLENAQEFLDTPGEWYLDRQQARLYYLPLPEERLATTEIVAPELENLMVFQGKTDRDLVSHLRFNNLTFAHTDYHLPPRQSGFSQNAWGVPGAILANGIYDCHWRNCTWKHIGGYAIELFRGCRHNQIIGCSFYDLGAGGIKIGERKIYQPKVPKDRVSHHNIVARNHIYNGGKFFPSASGIGIACSHDNLIAHNHVHDFYYTAIAIMGTWGFGLTEAYKNVVEHNHIHHIGKLSNGEGPIVSDLGGIYSLGNQPGTIIRDNKIHDIHALRYGGWGIYLDEGSSNVLVKHNLVYRTSHGGFSQHYGKENLICHNIFAFGEKAQIHRNKRDLKTAREEDFVSFYFKYNVVYWQEGKFISGLESDYQSNVVFEHNIYWKMDEPDLLLNDLSWRKWQQRDRHSLIADPLFIAPQAGNFKLQPNSPALDLKAGNWESRSIYIDN